MAGGSGLTRDTISLTHRSIESLRPAGVPYRISDQRCSGLAVEFRQVASRRGIWPTDRGSTKVRRVSLGRVTDVSLEKARERANELTSAARTGCDLIAQEEESWAAAASRLTVEKLIELYVRRRVSGRLRTAKEIERRLTRALSPLLLRYAADIRRRDIRELLDAVADQGIEREAEKRRQTVGAMFRWALSQDIVETDPTSGLKAYDPGTPRDRELTASEIEALWKWLDSDDLPTDQADILKLELLTGARCGEISGLCVEEIDREEWTWTLPAQRSKNKQPRVTPLVGLARQIISARLLGTHKGPLFKAEIGTTLTSARVGHFLLTRRDRSPIEKFNTHDLRRTVATMLAEMGQPLDLIATVIGHEAGGKNTRRWYAIMFAPTLSSASSMCCVSGMSGCKTLLPVASHPMSCASKGSANSQGRGTSRRNRANGSKDDAVDGSNALKKRALPDGLANGSNRPLPGVPFAPATEGMPQKAAEGATRALRQVRAFLKRSFERVSSTRLATARTKRKNALTVVTRSFGSQQWMSRLGFLMAALGWRDTVAHYHVCQRRHLDVGIAVPVLRRQ